MIFHWANHHRIEDFLRCGWIIATPNAAMHHHEYGFVCRWLCDCNPVIPR